jgi:nucleoside-diphosphate-sugar epimerase
MKPKTLVTGGAGFIGNRLVDALLERGHDVTVVDSLRRGNKLTPESLHRVGDSTKMHHWIGRRPARASMTA